VEFRRRLDQGWFGQDYGNRDGVKPGECNGILVRMGGPRRDTHGRVL
jgi:hypothetical protein